MEPLTLKTEYDQFADLIKPDEWIGFCRWITDEPDNMIEFETLARRMAEEASQQERNSWSEDGVDIKGLMERLAKDDDEQEEEE